MKIGRWTRNRNEVSRWRGRRTRAITRSSCAYVRKVSLSLSLSLSLSYGMMRRTERAVRILEQAEEIVILTSPTIRVHSRNFSAVGPQSHAICPKAARKAGRGHASFLKLYLEPSLRFVPPPLSLSLSLSLSFSRHWTRINHAFITFHCTTFIQADVSLYEPRVRYIDIINTPESLKTTSRNLQFFTLPLVRRVLPYLLNDSEQIVGS